jgi:N6-L-threonylcarbamoyladenine synthase
MDKLYKASKALKIKRIALSGGVSANTALRAAYADYAKRYGWDIYIPKFGFTTDNAAMIGIVGYYKFLEGDFCSMDKPVFTRTIL